MSFDAQNFDFSKTAVIKPPFVEFANKEIAHKYTRVVIDSRDRNTDMFPTPAQYDIAMEEDIEEVTSAEVVVVDMHLASYMVNANNNKVYATVSTVNYVADIPFGDYTTSSFADALSTALQTSIVGTSFETVYDSVRDRFDIWANSMFALDFKGTAVTYAGERANMGTMVTPYKAKSAARLIGFANAVYTSQAGAGVSPVNGYTNKLSSVYRRNFTENNYVVLSIAQMSVNKSINDVLSRSLALIQPSYMSLNVCKDEPIRKMFNPPIPRLTKVSITLRDYWGNLYDFQNQDHRIEIVFMSHKHISKYR